MSDGWRLVGEIIVLVPGLLIVSWVATRLLGIKRSWSSNTASVVVAWILGILGGWILAGHDFTGDGFVRDTLALAFLFTMVAAVGVDLLARPGTLARAGDSGL